MTWLFTEKVTLFERKWRGYVKKMPLSVDANDLVIYRESHSLWMSVSWLCTEDDTVFGRK
jgi:hypothetical protein